MPHARDNTHTRAERRGLLAGGTAALPAGAAIATAAHGASVASPSGAGDDAEILRLAHEFWALDAIVADWNAERVSEEVGEDAQDDQWECLDAMAAIRATTPEGIRTKADCFLHSLEVETSRGSAEDHARAFLADLAGRTAA